MDKTRGGINGIITGETQPDPSSVKLLEMLLLSEGKFSVDVLHESSPPYAQPRIPDIASLSGKLAEINEYSPEKFQAAKTVIEAIHKEVNYKSKPDQAASNLLKKATKPKL